MKSYDDGTGGWWPAGREALAPSIARAPGTMPLPPGMTPPPGVGPDVLQRIITLRQPAAEQIPLAADFNTLGFKTTVAVEAGVNIPGAEFVMPQGYVGRLDGVIFYIANMLLSTVVTFSVLEDGFPIPGFNNVAIFPGVAARVSNQFSTFTRLPTGCKLSVVYTNTDGGAYTVGGALSGWSWPETAGKQWMDRGADD